MADIKKGMSDGLIKQEAEHPSHYTNGNIECKDYIRDVVGRDGYLNYCRGNIIKYITRYDKKGTPVKDLEKIKVYVDFMLEEFR